MNCKIPFTKDIDFEKKVSEITSISLEHEINVEDGFLKGNFIVSGDFKSHEVSVNKEPFSYILPFEIEISDDVDASSIEFMIDDFTYEIVEQSILRVNIDFNVVASKKEKVEEDKKEEPLFRDAKELFEEDKDNLEPENLMEEAKTNSKEDRNEVNEEVKLTKEEQPEENKEETREVLDVKEQVENIASSENTEDRSDLITKETEDTIINSIGNTEDEYTTYHIHMVSEGETVETICTMYQSNINILTEYNDINELSAGDKLIIPEKNE